MPSSSSSSSPVPQSPIKVTSGSRRRSPLGSLQKTPQKNRRGLPKPPAPAPDQSPPQDAQRGQGQPRQRDDQPQVQRVLTFKEKRGPKLPNTEPDDAATKSAAAPTRARAAAVARLPLRRTLIRSSSKKCWEAMSPLVGYQRWRKMQFSMNWRMLLLLRGVANMSLLRLTDPDVPLEGKDVVEIADGDPNPDADVKFMASGAYRVAPDSILRFYNEGGDSGGSGTSSSGGGGSDGAGDRSADPVKAALPWCLLLGCPGHISIGILWPKKGSRAAYVEHFDSRGINESMQAGGGSFLSLPHMREYFLKAHGVRKLKSVNAVDFQEVELDVYCQTWIFYFVYMRLVRRHSAAKICLCIDAMDETSKLDEVKRFQHWLLEGLDVPGFAPGMPEPATVAECARLSVPDAERRAFHLPYKAPPSQLRRLALSPFSAEQAMREAAASKGRAPGAGRRLRASTRSSRRTGIWRKDRNTWLHHHAGARAATQYSEVSVHELATDAALAAVLLEPGVRICLQFDEAPKAASSSSTATSARDRPWRTGAAAPGAHGVALLKKAVKAAAAAAAAAAAGNATVGAAEAGPAQDVRGGGASGGGLTLACAFMVGRKRVPVDFRVQRLGFRHGCVLLRARGP